ncbi:membrane protein insertion efficiency factor YidD [Eubacteriales bacterium mix99]|nr:membrane protein insertion efficiency factor YidD [Clostridiales bacterium]
MKHILLFLIRAYRKIISPAFPPSCRFIPTCSEYSMQAIEKYGSFKGTVLSLRRILKCNPLHSGGYDPLK